MDACGKDSGDKHSTSEPNPNRKPSLNISIDVRVRLVPLVGELRAEMLDG